MSQLPPPEQQPSPQWGPPQQWAPPLPEQRRDVAFPAPTWIPAPPSMPTTPVGYHQFWRAPGIAPWRPIVVVLILAVAFFGFAVLATLAAVGVEVATGAVDPDDLMGMLEEGRVTPGLVLANSIAIGLLLPFALLTGHLVKQRPGFLHSVVGRVRWGWFWICVAASLVVLGLNMGIELSLTGTADLELQIRPYTWWLLIGLLLVTPFQAAAEEYLLRGVVFRTVGSWFRPPVVAFIVGAVLNSALFMVMHGAADPWLNVFYFSLGALLSWLTWRTGGLEAAAALHIVNNMIGFSIVPFQDVSGLFDRSVGTGGPVILWQLTASVILVVLLDVLARRRRLATLGRG
ncbi:CPBP family intramembrane glutamic endopeptidase [Tessaracoccus sp. Y36]|uniref:CPBP family intramembrane glutamic endopeptidase n=1 Tax=Tessaracoccus sp. ZS01 TaxID=1906324 RepID=UPI001180805E|nr:CPBP family intramembrane glutamic endopeptidase [Tessaracoccus sp. ZS01]